MGRGTERKRSRTRALVIEDHALLGQVLVASLEQEGIKAYLTDGPTLDDILSAALEFRPNLALLDLDLGEAGDGRDLIAPLRDMDIEIILVTGSRNSVQIAEALEAGARGVVHKDKSFASLRDAIRAVMAGESGEYDADRQDLLSELRRHREARTRTLAPFQRLTAREKDVLGELSRGKSATAIAEDAYVSLSTVRSQIRSVLLKLGVSSQLAAVARANESGWL